MWVGSYRSCACALDSGTSGALAAPSWLARRLASQLSVQQCGSGGSGPRLGIRLEDWFFWWWLVTLPETSSEFAPARRLGENRKG